MVPGQRNASNPSKFQFMIICHSGVDASNATLQIDDNIVLKPEPQEKVLGVMLDSKLNFNHHVNAICTKAARQLNVLARISRFLSTSSRMIIYNSFINSDFDYYPIVWHYCGKKNGDKIEKNQKQALRIMYRNDDSQYSELLRDPGAYTMLDKRLRSMLLHVFESVMGMNAKCLNDMYSAKQLNYSKMRQSVKLVQLQRKTTTVGLKTVLYLGAKLWNDNAVLCNELWNEDFLTFKWSRFRYQHTWRFSIYMKSYICPSYAHFSSSLFIVFSLFGRVQYLLSMIELWMILWNNFSDLSLNFVYIINLSLIF